MVLQSLAQDPANTRSKCHTSWRLLNLWRQTNWDKS